MSRTNGDRSRFNRLRKARIHDRARIRELRKKLRPQQPGIAPKDESTQTENVLLVVQEVR
jgi:hypothetical protein